MIIYSIIIGTTILFIILLNLFIAIPLYGYDIVFVFKAIGLNILIVFLIDDLIALIIHKLPKKWFHYEKNFFYIYKWERKFYEKIKIKKWKDHIPELGWLANFRKNKVIEPNNNIYVEKFLVECCYGETIHFLSLCLGFLILLIYPKYVLFFGLPVAIANGFIHYLSFAILRYTRPRLKLLYERNQRYNNKKV